MYDHKTVHGFHNVTLKVANGTISNC